MERRHQRVRFTVPDAHFTRAEIALDREDPNHRPPESVTFYLDSSGPPLELRDLARIFGGWAPGVPGPDGGELYNVQFDTPYRGARALLQQRVEVRVFAVLAAAPADGTRVTEITLRRDVWD